MDKNRLAKYVMTIIILGLILSSCQTVQEQVQEQVIVDSEFIDGQLMKPPYLTLDIDDKMYSTITGGYTWSIDKTDGSSQVTKTDVEAIPKLAKYESEIKIDKLHAIQLVFGEEPISVSSKRWLVSVDDLNKEGYDMNELKTEPVSITNNWILVQGGVEQAVYEINAEFAQGTVSYAFALRINNTLESQKIPLKADLKSKDYYGDVWEFILDRRYIVYIDGATKHLVFVSQFDSSYDEVIIPDEYFINLRNEQNSHLYWGVIGDKVVITYNPDTKESADGLVYYTYKGEGFKEIEMPIKSTVSLYNNEVILNDHFTYKLNEESLKFEIYYDEEDIEDSNLVYEDIFYYNDDEWLLFEAEESILNNKNFLPYSEIPIITYKSKEVKLYNIMNVGENNYGQTTEEHLLGKVTDNVFTPLLTKPVRCYDVDEDGIVYTGFGLEAKAYYYDNMTEKEYTLGLDSVVDNILLIKDYIYILTNGKDIYRYSREELIQNQTNQVPLHIDLLEMPGYLGEAQFSMTDNNEFLVAHIDNSNYYEDKPFKTYVFNQDLELAHEINGLFTLITQDTIIFGAYPYTVRCYLETGMHEVIREEIIGGILGYHKGYLVFNDAYEGPGHTWLVDINTEALDYKTEDEDYTVMIHPIYQNMITLHNHKDKKVDYLYTNWSYNKYELAEDGLYLYTYGEVDFIALPDEGLVIVKIGKGLKN